MTKRLLIAIAALALASFAFAGCGGDDDDSGSSGTPTEQSNAPAGDGATVTAEADPGGALAWTETELTTEAGGVTIEMINDSETPHNVVIEDDAGSDIAETDTTTGENASTTAEVEAGTYTFYCAVPGHREAGMEGTLTVK